MKRTLYLFVFVFFVLLAAASWAAAAGASPEAAAPAAGPPATSGDPIGDALFPVELVMRHRTRIGLSESQGEVVRGEVQKAQARFLDVQWKMQGATETLVGLLQAEHVDEARALAQAEEVMSLEREMKKTQLALLIRIKNALTAEQRAALERLRGEGRP
jgi:Spy/CpxP family protein refolding chaperone